MNSEKFAAEKETLGCCYTAICDKRKGPYMLVLSVGVEESLWKTFLSTSDWSVVAF